MATRKIEKRTKSESKKDSERRNRADRREKQKRADERRFAGYGEIIPDRRIKTRRESTRRMLAKRRAKRNTGELNSGTLPKMPFQDLVGILSEIFRTNVVPELLHQKRHHLFNERCLFPLWDASLEAIFQSAESFLIKHVVVLIHFVSLDRPDCA